MPLFHLNLQDYASRKPLICLTAFLAKATSSSVGTAKVGYADKATFRCGCVKDGFKPNLVTIVGPH